MWFTKAEDLAAIDELEQGTDRVAAVIAGAIVDTRLSEMLRQDLRRDDSNYSAKIRNELFNADGPLGNFGAKVGLAYLMGYYSEEANADLRTFAKIRNLFAHYAQHKSFGSDQVRALCSNFKLINTRVRETGSSTQGVKSGKITRMETVGFSSRTGVSIQLIDAATILKEPKGRFIATAKLFCAAFEIYSIKATKHFF